MCEETSLFGMVEYVGQNGVAFFLSSQLNYVETLCKESILYSSAKSNQEVRHPVSEFIESCEL